MKLNNFPSIFKVGSTQDFNPAGSMLRKLFCSHVLLEVAQSIQIQKYFGSLAVHCFNTVPIYVPQQSHVWLQYKCTTNGKQLYILVHCSWNLCYCVLCCIDTHVYTIYFIIWWLIMLEVSLTQFSPKWGFNPGGGLNLSTLPCMQWYFRLWSSFYWLQKKILFKLTCETKQIKNSCMDWFSLLEQIKSGY
jgi:hypothetical protein